MFQVGDAITVKTDSKRRFFWLITGQGTCRSCGAELFWCETQNKRRIPVNVPPGGETVTESHFATCPQANTWRKAP